MQTRPMLAGLTAFFLSTPALANAPTDLSVEIVDPAAANVYDATHYEIEVSNIGNKRANNVQLVIELPQTNTSPTVHVMGTLSAVDSRCIQVDTELHCALGRIKGGKSKAVSFDIALPLADQVLEVAASVSTSSNDADPANDYDADVAPLDHYAVTVQPGDAAHNRHCTGQGLTSFFECLVSPGSLSSHDIEFLANGELSIVGQPAYTGTWSQPTPTSLEFSYETGGNVVATFVGYGTSPDCFEGITLFPGSPYLSPYEVCL